MLAALCSSPKLAFPDPSCMGVLLMLVFKDRDQLNASSIDAVVPASLVEFFLSRLLRSTFMRSTKCFRIAGSISRPSLALGLEGSEDWGHFPHFGACARPRPSLSRLANLPVETTTTVPARTFHCWSIMIKRISTSSTARKSCVHVTTGACHDVGGEKKVYRGSIDHLAIDTIKTRASKHRTKGKK